MPAVSLDVCRYLDEVRAIAREAGRRIFEIYQQDFDIESKEDGSPLTEADRVAHEVIVSGLRRLTPDLPILSEEADLKSFDERRHWRMFWLVDPLDGTKEFINRRTEFTVNIALIQEGRPVLGVVLVPVTEIVYFACQGDGAYKQEVDRQPETIQVRTYRGGKVTIVASRSHASEKLKDYLDKLGDHETVTMGSSLKLCLVAEGKADLYPRLGPTSEWDIAAAQCVLEAAGGQVTDFQNRPLTYNKRSILNPQFLAAGKGDHDWAAYLDDVD